MDGSLQLLDYSNLYIIALLIVKINSTDFYQKLEQEINFSCKIEKVPKTLALCHINSAFGFNFE